MCFYIYAPYSKIQIEYASETVTLTKGDTSVITLDLLITNKSPDAVESVKIVYPRIFFPRLDELFAQPVGNFVDITRDLLNPGSLNNRLYLIPPCEIVFPEKLEDDEIELVIRQPDPKKPEQTNDYKGFIAGENYIELLPDLTPAVWKILTGLRFSLFVCNLDKPIQPNEARWFRWYVAPHQTALLRRNSAVWLKDWVLNRLISRYQILGPENVRYQLITALQTYIEQCAASNELKPEEAALPEAREFVHNIRHELANSVITIRDWRLHIFPGIFGDLDRVICDGDLKPSGTLPNYLVDPLARFTSEICYQWKTGEKYISVADQTNKGFFSVNFSATMPNKIVRFVPWVAFLIALWALIRTLLR